MTFFVLFLYHFYKVTHRFDKGYLCVLCVVYLFLLLLLSFFKCDLYVLCVGYYLSMSFLLFDNEKGDEVYSQGG